jgi:hypothetical protein
VEALRPEDATAVVPHPRYPEEPSSRISNGPSLPADPTPPTAGRVGSLFGLYPYSSTSFLRSSSASLRCFRFRHKKRPASTRRATATIGTTTATAIFPPPFSPPPPLEDFPSFMSPAVPVGPADEVDEPVSVGSGSGVSVDVISIVDVGWPETVGVCVMTDVITDGGRVEVDVVEGGSEDVVLGVVDVEGVVELDSVVEEDVIGVGLREDVELSVVGAAVGLLLADELDEVGSEELGVGDGA